MSVVLPTLLYLGLYVAQNTQAQNGYRPQPVITAQPGSRVPSKTPVTILCRGLPGAEAYEIYKVEDPELRDGRKRLFVGKTSTLYIQEMKPDKTGVYQCTYQSGGHLSQFSNLLHVVMTGAYDKPSLSSMTATAVAPGDNVMLQCFSRIRFEAFILTKEDAPQFTQRQSSTAQGNGVHTTFRMDRVTSTQAGTYRCYGAFNDDPYVWSHPSDPLQLQVREPPLDPTTVEPKHPQEPPLDSTTVEPKHPQELPLDPTTVEPKHPQATDHNQSQNHQAILIGFPVAIVLLLLLFLLLFFILRHRHRKAKNNATKTERQQQAVEPLNRLASDARDPQDVTYIQVAFNASTHETASAPSLLPGPTQASEYATLALR